MEFFDLEEFQNVYNIYKIKKNGSIFRIVLNIFTYIVIFRTWFFVS